MPHPDFAQMADDVTAAQVAPVLDLAPSPAQGSTTANGLDALAPALRAAVADAQGGPVVLVLSADQAVDLAVLAEFGTWARDTLAPMVTQMAPMLEQLGGGIMGRLLGGGK